MALLETTNDNEPSAEAGPDSVERPTSRRPRRGIFLVVLGVVIATSLGFGAVRLLDRGTSQVPYDDTAATGRIALCDATGGAVTAGSVSAPLAALVRGQASIGAGPGQTATLFAFQPRQGVESRDWSGLALTASALVQGESSPSLTPGADSVTLQQFLAGYPATWGGWVQLRLLLGSTQDGVRSGAYDALDLLIDGDRWRAVNPGNCA